MISISGGRLRIVGRLDVEDIVTQKRADELFGRPMRDGAEHIDRAARVRARRAAPTPTSRRNAWARSSSSAPMARWFRRSSTAVGSPTCCALQGVREITLKTAQLFDHVLGLKASEGDPS